MRKTARIILVTLIFGISMNLYSQTKDDAGNAYNEGVQYVKDDNFKKAIEAFEKAIQICDQVGPDADDLKGMASQQLPAQYYKSAAALYQDKKIDEAIKRSEKTIEVSKKYKNSEIESKTKRMLTILYYQKGKDYYKEKDYDNAIVYLDKAISIDPEYAQAYFYKGSVYNKKDDPVKMKESYDMAIKKAEANQDSKTASGAKKAGRKYLTNFAVKAIQKEKYDEALNYLNQAGEYGDGKASTYYYYALVYNKKKNWDEAIESAKKGLELEKGDSDAKAKHYFELGTAYQGKGDSDSACKAFKDAAYGDYKAQADYQIKQVLKCQ
jgi:tetratricopeptide (TPR) repeat protein